jgi:uncharacterized linocin/CFP29 family protein
MNDLLRDLAPISEAAWTEVEKEARRTLTRLLAARKLVDFVGPQGWTVSAISNGRTKTLAAAPEPGVEARLRRVQPLVELHIPFELDRRELEGVDRGARDPDLTPLRKAARAAALAEDRTVFHGFAEAYIEGIFQAAADRTLTIGGDYADYPGLVAEATQRLRSEGVEGPYGIALGPRCYTGLTRTTVGGYPVIDHVRRLLKGPIVSAPGVTGAAVLSLRGGDFELTVGRDLSIGYLDHDAATVRLSLQQSFTFQVLSPEAAVPLSYPAEAAAAG